MPRDVAGGLAEAVGRLAPAWCSDVASHSASTGTDPRDAMATSLFCRWLAAKLKSEQQAKSAKAMAEEARIAAMEGNKRDTIGESMKSYFAAGLTPAAAFKACRYWGVVLTAKYLAVHGNPDEAIEIIEAALTGQYHRDLADIFASTIKYEIGTSGMPLSDWRVRLASFVAKAGKLETFRLQGSEKGWCDNFIAGLAK